MKARNAVAEVESQGELERRILDLQQECALLTQKRDQTKREIETALAMGQQELDRMREKAFVDSTKIKDDTAKLVADKAEFAAILEAFNKEKAEFEKERTRITDLAAVAKVQETKLSNFMLLIKREAAKL